MNVEKDYDRQLNIRTSDKQMGFHSSLHYHRYEPTPYEALDRLFERYEMKSNDNVVDFGCGKGRLNFYLHHRFGAAVTGIEMNEVFYKEAMANLGSYRDNKDDIHFQCCLAEEYEIAPAANRFYFFNPFTVQIFRNVVNNILLSVEKTYRPVEIILYYPMRDYVFFLENHPSFEWKMEVKLGNYEKNENERFLIYQLAY